MNRTNVLRVGLTAVLLSGAIHGAPQSGTTYYVCPTGDDAFSGTSPDDAWRTLDRVNQQSLLPGDSVLLEGDSTFSGTLRLSPPEAGTPTEPIVFGSYGQGRAVISAGSGTGIDVYDVAGVLIQDLVIGGAGIANNAG